MRRRRYSSVAQLRGKSADRLVRKAFAERFAGWQELRGQAARAEAEARAAAERATASVAVSMASDQAGD